MGLMLFFVLGPPYGWFAAQTTGGMWSAWITSRWPGWLVWMLLIAVLGRRHPPPGDPYLELGPGRKAIGWLSLAVFVEGLAAAIVGALARVAGVGGEVRV